MLRLFSEERGVPRVPMAKARVQGLVDRYEITHLGAPHTSIAMDQFIKVQVTRELNAGNDGVGETRKMRVLVMVVLIYALSAAHVMAQTPYDGIWNVTILTKAGSCEPTARYALTVENGRVSGPQNASGVVGKAGNVRVSVGAAYANGQLDISNGSGKWNGASGGVACSGRWVASKQ